MIGLEATTPDAAKISSLFDSDVLFMVSPVMQDDESLLPAERAQVSGAVPKRRREFASGRACARKLLSELGFSERPLLRRDDRVPLWPDGAVGSISHTRSFVGVAVSTESRYRSIGVDLEDRELGEDRVVELVVREDERSWVERGGADEVGARAQLIFSAKECVYKCLYEVGRRPLDFHDVRIAVDGAGETFEVEVLGPHLGNRSNVLTGRFRWMGATVLTGIALPSSW